MPRLGEPVEPVRVDKVAPWWRAVDATTEKFKVEGIDEIKLPKAMPWPFD
jgi:hypothetical protein